MFSPEWHSHMNNLQSDDLIIHNICNYLDILSMLRSVNVVNQKWHQTVTEIMNIRRSNYKLATYHRNIPSDMYESWSQRIMKDELEHIRNTECFTKMFNNTTCTETLIFEPNYGNNNELLQYTTQSSSFPAHSLVLGMILTIPKYYMQFISDVVIYYGANQIWSIPCFLVDWIKCDTNADTYKFDLASFFSLPYFHHAQYFALMFRITMKSGCFNVTPAYDMSVEILYSQGYQLPSMLVGKNNLGSETEKSHQGLINIEHYLYRCPKGKDNLIYFDFDYEAILRMAFLVLIRWKTNEIGKTTPKNIYLGNGALGSIFASFPAEQCKLDSNTPKEAIFPELPGIPPWLAEKDPYVSWYALRVTNIDNDSTTAMICPTKPDFFAMGIDSKHCQIVVQIDDKYQNCKGFCMDTIMFNRNSIRTVGGYGFLNYGC